MFVAAVAGAFKDLQPSLLECVSRLSMPVPAQARFAPHEDHSLVGLRLDVMQAAAHGRPSTEPHAHTHPHTHVRSHTHAPDHAARTYQRAGQRIRSTPGGHAVSANRYGQVWWRKNFQLN